MDPSTSKAGMRHIVVLAVFFAACAALYIANLGGAPFLVHAEIRCWRIAQGMLESHDYLVPRLGTELRTQKPPLFYWMACATAKIAGAATPFTLRLPSALAALGMLALMLQWCKVLGLTLARTLLAMLALSTSYLYIVHARRGSFEMPLTFFCSLCLYACYRLTPGFKWSYGLLASVTFGLAFLTKATPVFLFVPLPFAVWLLLLRKLKPVLLDWRFYLLALIALIIGVSWYVVIMQHEPQARRIIFGEALLPLGVEDEEVMTAQHFAPPWFFLLGLWRTAAPMSLLIPVIAVQAWRNRGFPGDSAWRLLLLGVVLPFLVFSAIPQKQDHYLLPIFPSLALLSVYAGDLALSSADRFEFKWLQFAEWFCLVLVCILCAATAFGLHIVLDVPMTLSVLVAAVVGFAAGMALRSLLRRQYESAPFYLLCGTFIAMLCYFVYVRPIEEGFNSGEIYSEPGYNAAAWDKKFAHYPWLHKILKADQGEEKRAREERRRQKLMNPNYVKKKKDSGRPS